MSVFVWQVAPQVEAKQAKTKVPSAKPDGHLTFNTDRDE